MVGRLPYRIAKRRLGIKVLDNPLLVHALGPAVAPQFAGQNFPRSLKELSIVGDLIAQLPKAAHISFRLHGGTTNTLAFESAGFESKSCFTVEISPDTQDVLWRQMRDKTRNVIRRAEERLLVEPSVDIGVFLDFYEGNLHKAGRNNRYDRRTCYRLVSECVQRGVGRVLTTKDESGQIQSAVFTVWDSTTEFYFMSTRRQGSMNGATPLLIWEAIKHASERGLTFDMDGIHVVNNGVPNLLLTTGFGGTLKPRYVVQRSSPWISLANELSTFWKRIYSSR